MEKSYKKLEFRYDLIAKEFFCKKFCELSDSSKVKIIKNYNKYY